MRRCLIQALIVIGILGLSAAASAVTAWSQCSVEGGTCSYSGFASVRYGANTSWIAKNFTGGTACTNAVFGDPAYGFAKTCQVAFDFCANEGGTCAFSGTKTVRYGASTKWVSRTVTGSVACTNAVFGDPSPGVVKTCQAVSSAGVTTSVTPTPSPTPITDPTPATPTPTPTPTPVSSPPPSSGSMSQVSYAENLANIANPERGFYWQTDCGSQTLNITTMQGWRNNDGNTLIRCYFYLKNYKTTAIPQSVLDFFQTQMNTIRAAGFKTVLRFAYTESTTGDDAAVSTVLNHIAQLAPYLQKNSDVITNLEAGFIGAWGEWVFSQHFGNLTNPGSISAQNWADRKAVMDKLLSVLPADRMIKLRTQYEKKTMYGSSNLLTSEAFNKSVRARIGFHNDCFLASSNDYGTYQNNTSDYAYQSEETKYVPMGGETCAVNAPRTDCGTALQEMALFHWSDINQGFNVDVLNVWKNQGCFNTMKQKLGYRFVLKNGAYSTSARVGGTIAVSLNIINNGFASPTNERGLELILRNSSTGSVYRLALASDPRRWLPGQAIAINQTATLPANMPAGTYTLLLNLPDPAPALYSRSQYSIQLANNGLWESSTGFNNLGTSIVVSP